jgi:hypothetical protein
MSLGELEFSAYRRQRTIITPRSEPQKVVMVKRVATSFEYFRKVLARQARETLSCSEPEHSALGTRDPVLAVDASVGNEAFEVGAGDCLFLPKA